MNIIKINIANKQELSKMYIQQFNGGGLFVADNLHFALGAEVFLLITLAESGEKLAVNGSVAWVSPASAVGYPAGIGIQFNQDKAGVEAKSKLEIMLGGLLTQNHLSYTF